MSSTSAGRTWICFVTLVQLCNEAKRNLFQIHINRVREVDLRAKKRLRRTGIRCSKYSFTTQATHKPFDALAVEARDTLAAEIRDGDWALLKGRFCFSRRSFDDDGKTARICQISSWR
jgi:hypothetical protein